MGIIIQVEQNSFFFWGGAYVYRYQITPTSLYFVCFFMGMSLSALPIYPCRVVLYSAHGNEYIDLHFRPQPEVADGDDNISAGNKLRRLKMDPGEYG